MTTIHSFSFPAMGTDCAIHLSGREEAAIRTAERAEREVERIEAKYSRYRPDSYLSDINRTASTGGSLDVDEETGFLLSAALAGWQQSNGAFDITSGLLRQAWGNFTGKVPTEVDIAPLLARIGMDRLRWQPPRLSFLQPGMEIDLGGLAKEYAADRAADLCRSDGIAGGLVDLGGDIACLGPQADGQPWRIGIRDPRAPDHQVAEWQLMSGGLATSGDYERCLIEDGRRYGHILDARTGWPASGLASVSVQAESAMLAGLIATLAMLRGPEAPGWLTSRPVNWLIVTDTGEILRSAD